MPEGSGARQARFTEGLHGQERRRDGRFTGKALNQSLVKW